VSQLAGLAKLCLDAQTLTWKVRMGLRQLTIDHA
jgi:hypothetical protein